jgi:hypothetical protein
MWSVWCSTVAVLRGLYGQSCARFPVPGSRFPVPTAEDFDAAQAERDAIQEHDCTFPQN